jgi:hypothetical protein
VVFHPRLNDSITSLNFSLLKFTVIDSPEQKKKVTLKINSEKLYPLDPYCLGGGPDAAHSQILFED